MLLVYVRSYSKWDLRYKFLISHPDILCIYVKKDARIRG